MNLEAKPFKISECEKKRLVFMLKWLMATFVALYLRNFVPQKEKVKPFCACFDYNKNCKVKCLLVREACCLFSVVYLSPLPGLFRSVLFGHSVLFHCESSPYLFTVVVCHY